MNEFSNFDYKNYWEDNYKFNGTSGAGSYGIVGKFKYETINQLIKDYEVKSIIDFGCGDGNVVSYLNCENYLGFDIANSAVQRCTERFKDDTSKKFITYDPQSFDTQGHKADMVTSLDVLYHIIDEQDFIKTLDIIFSCSKKVIVLYTKITLQDIQVVSTIKDRNILNYTNKYTNFEMKKLIPQKYPDQSSAHFLIFEKKVLE